jgi:hypothetical protein
METAKKYAPWVICGILAIVIIVISMASVNQRNEYENNSSTYRDSVTAVLYSNKIMINTLQKTLDSAAMVSSYSKDSSSESKSASEKNAKVIIRTIYKDSIREVYVEQSESTDEYKKEMSGLKDSIAILNKKASEKNDHTEMDASYEEITKKDSGSTQSIKTANIRKGKAELFVHVKARSDGEISDAIGGIVEWTCLGPLFIAGEGKWDPSEINEGDAGIGLYVGPFRGYVGAGYDGEPYLKVRASADFSF